MKNQNSVFLIQFTPCPSHKGHIVIQIIFQMLSKFVPHSRSQYSKVNNLYLTAVLLVCYLIVYFSDIKRASYFFFTMHIPLVVGSKNLCGFESILSYGTSMINSEEFKYFRKLWRKFWLWTADSCLIYHGKDWIVFHVFMSHGIWYCCSCALCWTLKVLIILLRSEKLRNSTSTLLYVFIPHFNVICMNFQ